MSLFTTPEPPDVGLFVVKTEEPVRLVEATHTYIVGEGITEMIAPSLSEVMKSAGLTADYAGVDPELLNFRARVGRAVHATAYAMTHGYGDPVAPEDPFVMKHAEPHVESFNKWLAMHEVVPSIAESPLFNSLFGRRRGYACTPDFVGFINGDPWVIDYKTTWRVYNSTAIQTMGQRMAVEYTGKGRVRRGVLHLLRSSARAQVTEHKEDAEDQKTVESAVWCYHARERYVA